MTNKEKIKQKALEILGAMKQGVRYTEFVKSIKDALPDIPLNTIHGTVWNLEVQLPEQVSKPARGVYIHQKFQQGTVQAQDPPKKRLSEHNFYGPFADWLVNELEECTKAIPVGGSTFKDKWGTPDVIGVREPRKSDIIKFPTEIVSAEIKIDANGLITAFGQVCAYRLFSHKSYIVVPVDSSADDLARLDTLSRIFGIGLILFNTKDPADPDYQIRVRSSKHEPDMFYVNKYMKLIEDDLFT